MLFLDVILNPHHRHATLCDVTNCGGGSGFLRMGDKPHGDAKILFGEMGPEGFIKGKHLVKRDAHQLCPLNPSGAASKKTNENRLNIWLNK